MKKVQANVAVKANNGVVEAIGRSVIYTPKIIKEPSKKINWFDDSKFLKKPINENKMNG